MASDFARTVGRYWVEATDLIADGGYRGRADYSWKVDGYIFHGSREFGSLFPTAEAARENALMQFEALNSSGEIPS